MPQVSASPRLSELPALFREKAARLREDAAAEQPAHAWERAADLMEIALQGSAMELLTLDEAEVESGYTRRHLLRLIREGVIPSASPAGAPLILRAHLPRKPGYSVACAPAQVASSRAQLARAVANGSQQ